MCRYWLKMIGTKDQPCREEYVHAYVNSRGKNRMTRMQEGDMMILYAVGRRNPLYAVARVTAPYHGSGNPDWPHQVDIAYVTRLPVGEGVRIEDAGFQPTRMGAVKRGSSYIELDQAEYEQAARLLGEARLLREGGGATVV